MRLDHPPTPFNRYVGLYTLHQIEHPTDRLVLRVRIETLRYSFAPLSRVPLDSTYTQDPRAGVELVRQTVLPRLWILLDTCDPFGEMGLVEGQDALWRHYAAGRGLPAEPVPVPAIPVPGSTRRLPARSKTSERLARAQQALELAQTAASTVSALAALWQNWQIGKERRRLLQAQRLLLQDAIQSQLTGQKQALDHALDQNFVRGYLADHARDTAYPVIFEGQPGAES